MAILGGIAGSQSLGHAMGRISIDTSNLNQARAVIRSVAQEAETGFRRIGTAAGSAQRSFGAIAGSISALVGTFGVEFGAAGLAQLGRWTTVASDAAKSFERQSVAAVQLAGSQGKLNSLMAAYERATGGAIDKATALADLMQLQAIGFADTTEELTRFVTAARGIALATGRTQDYVISQLQLTIANQSTMRLDQIGLGVTEVQQRIDELRDSNSSLSREMAYQEAVLTIAEEKYGALATSAEAQATGAEKARKAWADLRLEFGLLADEPVGDALEDVDDALGAVNTVLSTTNRLAGQLNERFGVLAGLLDVVMNPRIFNPMTAMFGATARSIGDIVESSQELKRIWDFNFNNPLANAPVDVRSSIGQDIRAGILPGPGGMQQEQLDARMEFLGNRNEVVREWAQQVQEIEREAGQQRLEATRTYSRQRTQTIEAYERSIAREAEDFARERLRQEQRMARQIAEVREAAVERKAEWQADYAESIAEARADANERIIEMEEDYAQARIRRERDYRDNLLSAAGRLDAQAILAEQRRYERENQVAEETHRERVDDDEDRLQQRMEDEAEAHEERLRLAREADEERIRNVQEALAEQRRIEDEDRSIRLQRQAEDHEANLDRLAHNHAESLARMERDLAEERQQVDRALQDSLAEMEVYTEDWIDVQRERQSRSLELWKEFMGEIEEASLRAQGLREYQTGGYVPTTGPALLHGGEYVLNPQVTRTLNDMMGGMNQRGIVSAMAGNTRNASLNVAEGAIQITAGAGTDPDAIGAVVEEALVNTLRKVT